VVIEIVIICVQTDEDGAQILDTIAASGHLFIEVHVLLVHKGMYVLARRAPLLRRTELRNAMAHSESLLHSQTLGHGVSFLRPYAGFKFTAEDLCCAVWI
jgi:hypothetical protein